MDKSFGFQFTVGLQALLATGLFLSAGLAAAVEEPKFETLLKDGAFELRRYPALVIAEVVVSGDMDAASNRGFRAIADYIFGNNTAVATGESTSTKIAMTAPVLTQPVASGPEKIAMTAPVSVEALASNSMDAQQWRVQFVMPSKYQLATLPKPNNDTVKLREIPARTTAVHTYSWLNSEARVQQKTDELLAWMQAQKLKGTGAPQLARYDPPWTLPMWRRNEIQIDTQNP